MDKFIKAEDAVQCARDVAQDFENDGFIEEAGAARTVGDWLVGLPAADVVARDCYNRVLSENDSMREQLAQIGKKPGDSMDDVRPVVPCKDCKNWVEYTQSQELKGFGKCTFHDAKLVTGEGYCYWGVKKEEV